MTNQNSKLRRDRQKETNLLCHRSVSQAVGETDPHRVLAVVHAAVEEAENALRGGGPRERERKRERKKDEID